MKDAFQSGPEQISFLKRVTARFSHMQDLDTLAREVQAILDEIVDVPYTGLYLYDPVRDVVRLPLAKGFTEAERAEAERTALDRHPGTVMREQRLMHVADTAAQPGVTRDSARSFVVRSRLYIPVYSRGECVGAFGLAAGVPNAFDEVHITMLQYVADLAGLVWRNLMDTQALHEAKERAEAADQAKTAFLATVSHELRTPMNGVVGMAELLLSGPLQSEQREQAELVRRSALVLMELIEDLLDYGRIESGNMRLEPRPFRPETLVEDVVQLLRNKARDKGIALVADLDPELPEAMVGDVGHIRRVLTNLVGNAVKFTDHGRVVVRASSQQDGPAHVLTLEVEDTGIGIPDEAKKKLFERFSQADDSITRRFGGTGLGLSISQSLAQLMGGELRLVRSEVGVGSTFAATFSLEIVRKPTPLRSPTDAGVRLLIVDDNVVNRRVGLLLAQSLGWDARAVADGQAAIQAVQEGHFSLVLMDVHMPVMDGVSATARIRELSDWALLPVVAVTADDLPETRRRCLAVGMNAVLVKPLTREKLADLGARLTTPAAKHDLHVLVAEDDPVSRTILERMLERQGCTVDTVADGEAAFTALSTDRFDLCFMDMHMPRRSGMELLDALGGQIPCVLLTGDARPAVREAALARGARDVLVKPLGEQGLRRVLAAVANPHLPHRRLLEA